LSRRIFHELLPSFRSRAGRNLHILRQTHL
jgi:hypothetical protein